MSARSGSRSRNAAVNQAAGLPGDWPVPAADRARVRTEVARELFVAEHGREPVDARELAGRIANTPRFATLSDSPRPALNPRSGQSATPMTTQWPNRSSACSARADPSSRAMARSGRCRAGHLGMGRLVQQPAPLRGHRRHSPSRSRWQKQPPPKFRAVQ
jgi:hypothetical protein